MSNGGFTTIPNWIIDYLLSSVPEKAVKVMLGYLRFAGKDGLTWPSIAQVSSIAKISPRSVQRWVRILVEDLHLMSKVGICRKNGDMAPEGTAHGRGWFVKYRLATQDYIEYWKAKPSND